MAAAKSKSRAKPKAPSSLIGKIRDEARKARNATWVEQRQKLLGAAGQALREKGLERVTMADIAARLGGDRASIYYYFSNKHEIFVALVEDTLVPLVAATEQIADRDAAAKERLAAMLELVMETYERHYPYMFLYVQEDMRHMPPDVPRSRELRELGDRSVGALRRIIRDGQRSGEFRQDLDAELMLMLIHGALCWTHRWFVPGDRYSAHQVAQSFCEIAVHGLGK